MLFAFPKPTIVAVMSATVPVHVGLFEGALVPINVDTVVEKLASLPKAKASSFKVSKVVGAAPTKLLAAVST